MIEFDLEDVDIISTLADRMGYQEEYTYVTVSADIEKEDNSFDHEFGIEEKFEFCPSRVELVVQEQGRDIREVLLDEDAVKSILPEKQYEALLSYCQNKVEQAVM